MIGDVGMDELKYSKEDYETCDIYGNDDTEISCYKCRLVKCRKPHTCGNCGDEIPKGGYALCESGFMDGGAVSCYTCVPCMDSWISESRGKEDSE